MTKTKSVHPAQFSPEVLALLRNVGPERGKHVHDPMAGPGIRLGELADELGWEFTGTEIEAPFIVDRRVAWGNAVDPTTYPREPFIVVTSPAYPNGMSDDFRANDSSDRRTYRSARAQIVGHDEPLHEDNQGRWGYRGTPLYSSARAVYWTLARRIVRAWAQTPCIEVYLNVSDFVVGKNLVEPVEGPWATILDDHGFLIVKAYPVLTRRWRNGANRDARVANEVVLYAIRRL